MLRFMLICFPASSSRKTLNDEQNYHILEVLQCPGAQIHCAYRTGGHVPTPKAHLDVIMHLFPLT